MTIQRLGRFTTLLMLKNQVSNILRQLHHQHHLDCLWSWMNLHSFCRRYFQTRLYVLFTVKVKSLGEVGGGGNAIDLAAISPAEEKAFC